MVQKCKNYRFRSVAAFLETCSLAVSTVFFVCVCVCRFLCIILVVQSLNACDTINYYRRMKSFLAKMSFWSQSDWVRMRWKSQRTLGNHAYTRIVSKGMTLKKRPEKISWLIWHIWWTSWRYRPRSLTISFVSNRVCASTIPNTLYVIRRAVQGTHRKKTIFSGSMWFFSLFCVVCCVHYNFTLCGHKQIVLHRRRDGRHRDRARIEGGKKPELKFEIICIVRVCINKNKL